jgi:glutathione S-transferase
MRLIGMLDSPYVRRVAISLSLMELRFRHEALSVFRNWDAFAAINPVVKAPTLVTDDGTVLMDSALILEYAERLAPPERRLTPETAQAHAHAQRIVGLALAACEKTVQLVYERTLRPPEKQHAPWIARVQGQLRAAYRLLETEIQPGNPAGAAWLLGARPLQADITAAVAWRFTQHEAASEISAADHPALAALSARAEALPAFVATPLA